MSVRIILMTLLSFITATAMSCEQTNTLHSKPETAPSPSPNSETGSVCERLPDIKILPFKDEPVDDQGYNALLQAGEKAVPCLIGAINDTRQMPDPRTAPKVGMIQVGDVAYFLLIRFTNLDFVELLPAEVRKKYGRDGVYGYFEYIDENDNRQKLQDAAYSWYEKKYNRNLRQK